MTLVKNKPKKTEAESIRRIHPEIKSEVTSPGPDISELLKKAPKSQEPINIKPMLATLIDEPFDDPGWMFEVKWDGYRTIAYINNGRVQLSSRNNKSFTDKYYTITQSLQKWQFNAVIDGEIIVLNDKGLSDFSALQNWRSDADGELMLYVFDLLWYEGRDLMSFPLSERQTILKSIMPSNDDRIRISQSFPEHGKDFFEAADKLGLEGIIAKKANSNYIPDNRSKYWLKIKVHKRQEFVIGGYTLNEGSGKLFSSLLLGVYEKGIFQFAGKVGTGFKDKGRRDLMSLFKPLVVTDPPFETEPDVNEPSRFRPNPPKAVAVWLKPEIVCEVSFSEITKDGAIRHPSFKGIRTDKKAIEVIREKAVETQNIVEERNMILKAPVQTRNTLLNPNEETQVKNVAGHNLKFTNLSKLYWPEEGVTKRDMLNYYYQVAEYIVPYLKDRPQSLNRFPNGIHSESFYQKDVKGKAPEWIKTYPYVTSEGDHKEFCLGGDEATLLWMASLGCIEMNPLFSRVQKPDFPDYCIIDLDPDQNTFEQVIQAAWEVKKVLDSLRVPSYPKTSGSTGIHIYIPLGANYTYDQSQMFGRLIASMVHERIPGFTSVERLVTNRHGKMYIDFLQNRPGATIASVYSLRPKPGAPVSMPLHWDEVKKGLQMTDFNIRNAVERLKRVGDLFKGVLEKGIDMAKILENIKGSK